MSAIFLQRSVQVLSRTLQSRNQPKPDPRQERKPQPVAEHTEVGRNIHREGGNLMRQVRDYEPRDCFEGPECKQRPERTPDQGKQKALRSEEHTSELQSP